MLTEKYRFALFISSLALLISALAVPNSCPAGVADIQLSGINEIVRVSQLANGGGGRGSGSIFANVFDERTETRYLCVLTADHVLKGGNNGSIAFGNTAYNTNSGPFYPASYSALGQYKYIYVEGDPNFHKPDLAVMVVPVPDTPFFQGLEPFNLVTPSSYDPDRWVYDQYNKPTVHPLDLNERYSTTLRGYGLTGPLTTITTAGNGNNPTRFAFVEDLFSYGTQRFSNNVIERYEVHSSPKYRDVMSVYQFGAGGVIGEGAGMRGDSGGPMLNDDAAVYLLSNNTLVPGFTRDIEAVFVRFVRRFIQVEDDDGNIIIVPAGEDTIRHPLRPNDPDFDMFIVDFGNQYAGVTLIPEYIDWANDECLRHVPEPGSLTLLAFGAATILLRRRRQP